MCFVFRYLTRFINAKFKLCHNTDTIFIVK